ncbi:flagellar export protein FliJ [Sporosarcina jiandibaonis]|uniref:flagellar export protein FliJ n=1 Tax=Sporosarcina jiandibaonis TaxID=2715535 RepID=UPI001554AF9F
MTQFNFQFQKILDIKENEKDFAQVQMADAIKRHEAGCQKKESILSRIIRSEQTMREKQQVGMNISELRELENYIYQLQTQLMDSQRELEHLQKNVSKTQNHLQLKSQEQKIWDNLKEQKMNQHIERSKVIEQNFFDELASTRFYRTAKASLAERG